MRAAGVRRRSAAHSVANAQNSSCAAKPSAGLVGIALAMAACEEVTLFGFSGNASEATSKTCAKYYECAQDEQAYFSEADAVGRHHDWAAKSHLVRSWIAQSNGYARHPPLPQRAQQAVVDYTLWIEKFEGKQIATSKGTTFPPKLPSPSAPETAPASASPASAPSWSHSSHPRAGATAALSEWQLAPRSRRRPRDWRAS